VFYPGKGGGAEARGPPEFTVFRPELCVCHPGKAFRPSGRKNLDKINLITFSLIISNRCDNTLILTIRSIIVSSNCFIL